MPQDLIRYDLLVQDALKGVVRKVLTDAATAGLPGDHHFYVSFRTGDPGVRVSQRLRDEHPDEMTIVLQHQFWDLQVTEHTFEVGLSFSGIPERLLVPFEALSGFFDPSVQFGLKLDLAGAESADNDETGVGDAPVEALPAAGRAVNPPAPPATTAVRAADNEPTAGPATAGKDDADASIGGSGQVVSLDAFRKKT